MIEEKERERERKAGLAFVKRCTQRLNRSLPGPSRETRLPINNRLLPRRMLDEEIEALTTPRSREGKKEKKEGKRRRGGGGGKRQTVHTRCARTTASWIDFAFERFNKSAHAAHHRCNHRIRILPSLPTFANQRERAVISRGQL